uniref:Uncharacterized protein n=1 Tax=mine drainage metagenome TaxID=410659 RepID=E6PLH2_9ZZZZ
MPGSGLHLPGSIAALCCGFLWLSAPLVPRKKKAQRLGWAKCLNLLVGAQGLEPRTY